MRGAEKALWEGEELRDSGSWGLICCIPALPPCPSLTVNVESCTSKLRIPSSQDSSRIFWSLPVSDLSSAITTLCLNLLGPKPHNFQSNTLCLSCISFNS